MGHRDSGQADGHAACPTRTERIYQRAPETRRREKHSGESLCSTTPAFLTWFTQQEGEAVSVSVADALEVSGISITIIRSVPSNSSQSPISSHTVSPPTRGITHENAQYQWDPRTVASKPRLHSQSSTSIFPSGAPNQRKRVYTGAVRSHSSGSPAAKPGMTDSRDKPVPYFEHVIGGIHSIRSLLT